MCTKQKTALKNCTGHSSIRDGELKKTTKQSTNNDRKQSLSVHLIIKGNAQTENTWMANSADIGNKQLSHTCSLQEASLSIEWQWLTANKGHQVYN